MNQLNKLKSSSAHFYCKWRPGRTALFCVCLILKHFQPLIPRVHFHQFFNQSLTFTIVRSCFQFMKFLPTFFILVVLYRKKIYNYLHCASLSKLSRIILFILLDRHSTCVVIYQWPNAGRGTQNLGFGYLPQY